MLNAQRILVSANSRAALGVAVLSALVVSVSACGQRGPLYLPTDPAAAQRATLPQTVVPGLAPDAPASNGNATSKRDNTAVPAAGVGAPAGGTAR